MSDVLITPPLPEELWYRIREMQTKGVTGAIRIEWEDGKVARWVLEWEEISISGRNTIRMQKRK